MRRLACSLALLVLVAGCRRGPGAVDPLRPDQLAPCPSGAPHLVIALATGHSDEEQALLRYDQTLSACRGAVVPYADYGTIASVGGLSDGTDLVGFSGPYGSGGLLVRFEEATERGRVEDESLLPVSIAALSFEGRPAVAVVWGSRSSSDSGDRLDVYAEDDLARLGSWDVTYSLVRRGGGSQRTVGAHRNPDRRGPAGVPRRSRRHHAGHDRRAPGRAARQHGRPALARRPRRPRARGGRRRRALVAPRRGARLPRAGPLPLAAHDQLAAPGGDGRPRRGARRSERARREPGARLRRAARRLGRELAPLPHDAARRVRARREHAGPLSGRGDVVGGALRRGYQAASSITSSASSSSR
ncbi:MAG: hypothetical protein M5U28_55225 [Sandaracinaceae bacterium]|nr:hypothetical protein [Sandaracinaceae bacterium]